MASIHVRFGEVSPSSIPVYQRIPRASEVVTSSATTAATTASANDGEYVTISAIDGTVYATIDSTPVALASGAGMDVIISGQTKDFGPLKSGDKVAVIDA